MQTASGLLHEFGQCHELDAVFEIAPDSAGHFVRVIGLLAPSGSTTGSRIIVQLGRTHDRRPISRWPPPSDFDGSRQNRLELSLTITGSMVSAARPCSCAVASTVARIGRITTQPRNPEAARTLETADKRGHLQTAETGSSETWVGSPPLPRSF